MVAGTRISARQRAWFFGAAAVTLAVIVAFLAFRDSSSDSREASLHSSEASSTQSSLVATAASIATAPAQMIQAADTGEPVSTGASRDGATLDGAAPAGGASPAGVVPPIDLGTVPPGALSRLDVSIETPQTYRCAVRVLGWANFESGVVALHVDSAELLGPIDPTTGEPSGEPDTDDPDNGERMVAVDVLASTNPDARTALRAGDDAAIYLVLLPSGDGSTLFVDRVK